MGGITPLTTGIDFLDRPLICIYSERICCQWPWRKSQRSRYILVEPRPEHGELSRPPFSKRAARTEKYQAYPSLVKCRGAFFSSVSPFPGPVWSLNARLLRQACSPAALSFLAPYLVICLCTQVALSVHLHAEMTCSARHLPPPDLSGHIPLSWPILCI